MTDVDPGGIAPTPDPIEPANPVTDPAPAPVADPVDWRSSLPEDLQANPALADIKDVEGLAKSMINAQKLVGMDKDKLLTVPGEDADEDAWGSFYTKLGRPEKAEDYTLSVGEELKETVQITEEMDGWYKDTAHKYGLTNKQTAGVYEEFAQWAAGLADQGNQNLEGIKDQSTAALKQEWGSAYDQNIQGTAKVLNEYATEEFVGWLDESGMGSHPDMVKFVHSIHKAMGDDSISDVSKAEVLMTPAEASAQIAQKFNDKTFMEAYQKADHPSHKWAVDEMSKLYQFQTAGN